MSEIALGTMYELNKVAMNKLEPLTSYEKENKSKELKSFFMRNSSEKYFMLMCKEQSDYTIFHIPDIKRSGIAVKELFECCDVRGKLLSIDPAKDSNAFEIWIKDNDEWHYLNTDGSMHTGWLNKDGFTYLLYSNGSMAHDTEIYGYSIDSNGHAININ